MISLLQSQIYKRQTVKQPKQSVKRAAQPEMPRKIIEIPRIPIIQQTMMAMTKIHLKTHRHKIATLIAMIAVAATAVTAIVVVIATVTGGIAKSENL
jgi:negative regulator of sigma E activity